MTGLRRPGSRISVGVLLLLVLVFGWTVATARHVHRPAAAAVPTTEYSLAPLAVATLSPARVPAPNHLQPNHLYLPALKVTARIVPVRATATYKTTWRTISLNPPAPAEVGLYTGGARLDSDHGTVLIVGHINFNGVSGAFRNLSATPLASDIWVTDAANHLTHWRVYANPVVTKDSASWPVDVFDSSGSRRLVLASCTGTLAYVNGYGYSYDDNQFIYATPVST